MKDIKIFLKKKKKKNSNMVANITKISQKMKKMNKMVECGKKFIMIIRKYFNLENWFNFAFM